MNNQPSKIDIAMAVSSSLQAARKFATPEVLEKLRSDAVVLLENKSELGPHEALFSVFCAWFISDQGARTDEAMNAYLSAMMRDEMRISNRSKSQIFGDSAVEFLMIGAKARVRAKEEQERLGLDDKAYFTHLFNKPREDNT